MGCHQFLRIFVAAMFEESVTHNTDRHRQTAWHYPLCRQHWNTQLISKYFPTTDLVFFLCHDSWSECFSACPVAWQKDEVYLNLVLDFVPETVYRVARHFNKAKSIIPIIYVKVLFFFPLIFRLNLSNPHQCEPPIWPRWYHFSLLRFRCTCTSCFAAWLTSIPRVCVTETSSPKTCWWTLRLPSSSCVTLAGEPDVYTMIKDGRTKKVFVQLGSSLTLCSNLSFALIDSAVPSSWSVESPTCRISARGIIAPLSSFLVPQTTRQTLTSGQRAAFWLSCCWDSQYSQETVGWISWSRLSRWESPSWTGAANIIQRSVQSTERCFVSRCGLLPAIFVLCCFVFFCFYLIWSCLFICFCFVSSKQIHVSDFWSYISSIRLQVLGTPTREQIREMNPNYTEFKFPQIKAHPWTKVSWCLRGLLSHFL